MSHRIIFLLIHGSCHVSAANNDSHSMAFEQAHHYHNGNHLFSAFSLTTRFSALFSLADETIDSSLVSTPPAGVTATSRDKDTKDNNNNTATNNETNGRSAALERAYVHDVYENCEEPVGSIRPKVAQFLSALDPGCIVCDVGCGNGRYLTAACNPAIYSIGVDRCYRLAKVAGNSGGEVSKEL
jgi:hypothetical protein